MVFIYLYFVELLIRPQDWNPLFLGLPTHWILVLPAFAYAFLVSPNRESILRSPEGKFLLLYTAFAFIGTFMAQGYWSARVEFMKTLKVASIFFLMYLILNEEKRIRQTLMFILVLGGLLGAHALQQAMTGVGWAGVALDSNYEEIRVKWVGIWDGSNGFALLFGILLPIALEYLLGGKTARVRFISLVCILLISSGLFFCNSRGSTLAILVGLAFYAASRFKWKQTAIVALIFIALAGSFLPSRMSKVDTGESSVRQRMWAWEQGLSLVRKNPLAGVGKGEFVQHNQERLQSHNNYVQVMAEEGIVGYFLFMGFLWFPMKRSLILQWRGRNALRNDFQVLRVLNTSSLIFVAGTFFIVIQHDLMTSLFGILTAATWSEMKRQGLEFEKIGAKDILGILCVMLGVYSSVWMLAVADII